MNNGSDAGTLWIRERHSAALMGYRIVSSVAAKGILARASWLFE